MIIRKVEVNENRALAKLHMQVMPDFFGRRLPNYIL